MGSNNSKQLANCQDTNNILEVENSILKTQLEEVNNIVLLLKNQILKLQFEYDHLAENCTENEDLENERNELANKLVDCLNMYNSLINS